MFSIEKRVQHLIDYVFFYQNNNYMSLNIKNVAVIFKKGDFLTSLDARKNSCHFRYSQFFKIIFCVKYRPNPTLTLCQFSKLYIKFTYLGSNLNQTLFLWPVCMQATFNMSVFPPKFKHLYHMIWTINSISIQDIFSKFLKIVLETWNFSPSTILRCWFQIWSQKIVNSGNFGVITLFKSHDLGTTKYG